MKTIFKINIFTYLFFLLSILSGYFRETIIIYIILSIHELGHVFFMKRYNIHINSITLYPYGGIIDSNIFINMNSIKTLIISLGGIISQLVLMLFFYILYNYKIIDIYYYNLFFKNNIYIIIFNLIPIYPLDGFKILNSIIELFLPFRKSLFTSLIINFIFLVIFLTYLYIYKINNYVIITFLIVSLIEYIKSIKYIFNKFYLERIIYDFKYNGLVSVNSKKNMFKNKRNYINGVDEKYALKRFDIL